MRKLSLLYPPWPFVAALIVAHGSATYAQPPKPAAKESVIEVARGPIRIKADGRERMLPIAKAIPTQVIIRPPGLWHYEDIYADAHRDEPIYIEVFVDRLQASSIGPELTAALKVNASGRSASIKLRSDRAGFRDAVRYSTTYPVTLRKGGEPGFGGIRREGGFRGLVTEDGQTVTVSYRTAKAAIRVFEDTYAVVFGIYRDNFTAVRGVLDNILRQFPGMDAESIKIIRRKILMCALAQKALDDEHYSNQTKVRIAQAYEEGLLFPAESASQLAMYMNEKRLTAERQGQDEKWDRAFHNLGRATIEMGKVLGDATGIHQLYCVRYGETLSGEKLSVLQRVLAGIDVASKAMILQAAFSLRNPTVRVQPPVENFGRSRASSGAAPARPGSTPEVPAGRPPAPGGAAPGSAIVERPPSPSASSGSGSGFDPDATAILKAPEVGGAASPFRSELTRAFERMGLGDFSARGMAGVVESRVASVSEGMVVAAWEHGRSAKWVMRETGLSEAQVRQILDGYLSRYRGVGQAADRARVLTNFLGDADPALVESRRQMERMLRIEFESLGTGRETAAARARIHASQSATIMEAAFQEGLINGRSGRSLMQRWGVGPDQVRGWLDTYLRGVRNIDDAGERARIINEFFNS